MHPLHISVNDLIRLRLVIHCCSYCVRLSFCDVVPIVVSSVAISLLYLYCVSYRHATASWVKVQNFQNPELLKFKF